MKLKQARKDIKDRLNVLEQFLVEEIGFENLNQLRSWCFEFTVQYMAYRSIPKRHLSDLVLVKTLDIYEGVEQRVREMYKIMKLNEKIVYKVPSYESIPQAIRKAN